MRRVNVKYVWHMLSIEMMYEIHAGSIHSLLNVISWVAESIPFHCIVKPDYSVSIGNFFSAASSANLCSVAWYFHSIRVVTVDKF